MPKNSDNEIPTRSVSGRLSLPLTEDGSSIAWDNVRESTAQRFAELVSSDPVALEKIGLAAGGSTESTEGLSLGTEITQENVGAVLDAINVLSMAGFKMALPHLMKNPLKIVDGKKQPMTIDPDILNKVFKLTETQHQELDPRALRIAKKYTGNLPEVVKKHLDLFILGGMFMRYSAENAQMAIKAQFQRDYTKLQTAASIGKTAKMPDSDLKSPVETPTAVHQPPSNGGVVDHP